MLLLVFSVTPFKIDQNKKLKPFNRLSPESGNRKKVDMQRLSPRLRGEKLNYNSCTSLLLRKSQNLLFLASEVQWALIVYRVCSIHVFFNCIEPCPYLACHVTTIENV